MSAARREEKAALSFMLSDNETVIRVLTDAQAGEPPALPARGCSFLRYQTLIAALLLNSRYWHPYCSKSLTV